MSVFDDNILNKKLFTTEQRLERSLRPAAREVKLKREYDELSVPKSFHRKHYLDWTGKYHRNWVKPPKRAVDIPVVKLRYDIYSDTRSIWPTP